MTIKTILGSCLLCLLLFSFCKKPSEPASEQTGFLFLKVEGMNLENKEEITVHSEGGRYTIRVTSNVDWNVENISDWITVSPKSGSGNQNLIIEVHPNQAGETRENTVDFRSEGKSLNVLKFKQTGIEEGNGDEMDVLKPVFDVNFNEDGSAIDASQKQRELETKAGVTLSTVYSKPFDRYIARFNPGNPGSSASSGFYKVDYANDIEFENILQGSNSFETIFMLNMGPDIPNEELKMFSGHQAGGTGFLVSNGSRGHQITFLPHIGGEYVWTQSGITPEKGEYYDVVGVWDRSEGLTYIYVNGELKDIRSAEGSFDFTAPAYSWLGIGGDPASETTAQAIWKGDVVLARIYDKALSKEDVQRIWDLNKSGVLAANSGSPIVGDVNLPFGRFLIGSEYRIKGKGFSNQDRIVIKGVDNTSFQAEVGGSTTGEGENFTITLPVEMESGRGRYRFILRRGKDSTDLGFTNLFVVDDMDELETKVIAHRGYYRTEGAAENSIASLRSAQEIGVYGSEFDVQMTLDGQLVIHHDDDINGIVISNATYDQIKDIDIGNGEGLPLFSDFLTQGKKDPDMKLIVELKDQHSKAKNDEMAGKIVNYVKDYSISEQVVYISFSAEACKKVHELQPEVPVYPLSAFWSLEELVSQGMTGIDYNISAFRNDPDLVNKAHDLGLKVNVWTIDSESDIFDVSMLGVDYITTNEPVRASDIIGGSN